MDPQALDFDSSDFEPSDQETPLKKSRRGEKISLAILENQAINRPQSKKALRTLTYSHGAPGTQLHQEVVTASWDAFCQTVSHNITTCPTGDLIFRYIDTIVENTKPTIPGKYAPSLSVIRMIWVRLLQLLQFRHHDFHKQYTPYYAMRINVHLDHLIRQGKLIRGDWFKKMWIGFMLVLKMATAWIKDAFENGTHSWDITISKLTSVLLQSALSSRSGDITRSQLYEGLECLCWGHIILKLESPGTRDNAPNVQDLKGIFELQFTKNKKSTRNATHTVFCNSLSSASQSIACPIKLLLVLALRLGYVYGRTIEDCLAHTAHRMDRTIQWKNPNAPVFCKMNGNSAFLQLNEPAGQHQVRCTLQQMALLTGVLDRVDTRGLRRGALRDQAYLGKVITGVANRCTALVAGHSSNTFARGVTQDYVGALEEPMYNLRAELPHEDRMAPAVAHQGGPPIALRRDRIAPHEINVFMKAHDMDVGDKNQRKKATRLIKKQRIADWCLEARNESAPAETEESGESITEPPNLMVPEKNQLSPDTNTKTGSKQAQLEQTGSEPLRQGTIGEVNTSQGRNSNKRKASNDNTSEPKRSFLQPPSSAAVRPELLDPELFNVDPAGLNTLANTVFACEGDGSHNLLDLDSVQSNAVQTDAVESGDIQADAVDEAMMDEMVTGNPVSPDILLAPLATTARTRQFLEATSIGGNDFVHYFSTINIFLNQAVFDRNDMVEVAKYVPCGNSRDPPTPFLYVCSKGCGHSKELRYKIVDHEVNCKGGLREKPFKCQRSGCQRSFKTDMSLRAHVSDVHDYKPITCDKCPGQPNVVYESKKELKKHRNAVHCVVEKQPCPLQDQCGFKNEYSQKSLLRQHLHRKHHLTNEQIKAYVPDGRKGNSNNKGKKRRPKGWHLAGSGVEKDEAFEEGSDRDTGRGNRDEE